MHHTVLRKIIFETMLAIFLRYDIGCNNLWQFKLKRHTFAIMCDVQVAIHSMTVCRSMLNWIWSRNYHWCVFVHLKTKEAFSTLRFQHRLWQHVNIKYIKQNRSIRNNNVTNYKILARQKIHENPQIEKHQLLSLYNKDTQETILKLYYSMKKIMLLFNIQPNYLGK